MSYSCGICVLFLQQKVRKNESKKMLLYCINFNFIKFNHFENSFFQSILTNLPIINIIESN